MEDKKKIGLEERMQSAGSGNKEVDLRNDKEVNLSNDMFEEDIDDVKKLEETENWRKWL